MRAGERVLDVAAGNGNATLAAARRAARVTSTDYVRRLLDKGRARARAEGLPVQFQVADAEALPFDDASFDVVLSTFGVMFTPDHARAAGEMLRVCAPAGRIGLANWTPERLHRPAVQGASARHVPPPAGVQPPSLWGTEAHLQTLFGAQAAQIDVASDASSTSATARPRTSSRCSATGTARRTRPSPRSMPPDRRSARARPHRAARTTQRRRPELAGGARASTSRWS